MRRYYPLLLAVGLGLLVSACSSGSDDFDAPAGDNGTTTPAPDPDPPPENQVEADFHTLQTPPLANGQFELVTLSTLPDTVTDGDVLAALRGLSDADQFTVLRNGDDVSATFQRQENGEVHGLVGSLQPGVNTLSAVVSGPAGERSAVLTVRNHPITGPVISGPHQTPFICETEAAGLGAPLDDDCSVETRFQWFYRSAVDQQFQELADPFAPYPPDTAQTETEDGRIVPYVVRVESATINRGIARIAVLDDPAARGPDAPFEPNWNRRVYYVYGESCGVGYHQGVNDPSIVLGPPPNPADISSDRLFANIVGVDQRLGKGDVIVHSTLSAFGVHCNPLVSIETTMMIKEHITEQYGLIDAVVGTNGSGAALQQYNAANNAPGLLDAAMPTATFADIPSTAMTVTDCGLLQNYYANGGSDLDMQQQAAINGHNLLSGNQLNAICQSWVDAFLDRVIADTGCDGSVPDGMIYDPDTNPTGVRCTVQDANVNIFGRDPATGFARRPLDNIGVQYGLDALNQGVINFNEFLALNRDIGGLDIDGNFVPQRHSMDSETAALTYRIGGVIGRGALAETPVMDLAPYLDLIPVANIHEAVRPFTVRARLREQTGQDVTQSIWRGVLTQPDAYAVMEQWFTNIANNGPSGDRIQDVMMAKPGAAADRCVIATLGGRLELPDALLLPLGFQAPLITTLPGLDPLLATIPGLDTIVDLINQDVPLRLDVPEDFDSGTGLCTLLLPVTGTPRMVAGMPLSDDIIKCQLKPIDAADYPASTTAEQLAELATVFPNGVCDYSKPGVGDVEQSMIWASVGGSLRQEPFELRWRAARSAPGG